MKPKYDGMDPSKQTSIPTDIVKRVYNRYVLGMEVLNKAIPFFNMKSPIMYWADARLRFNVFVPQRAKGSKQWKSMYRSALTRNRVLGIVAHVLGMMPRPSISAQNEFQDEDHEVSMFLKDYVEWSQEHEEFDIKLFWALVTCVVEGTVLLKDDYGKFEREIKDIIDIDESSGRVKWSKKLVTFFEGAFSELVCNDELLLPNPTVFDLQEQNWLLRRRRMPHERFMKKYGRYAKANEVVPGNPNYWVYASDYFMPYRSYTSLAKDQVEVIEEWDPDLDTYQIVANGVQLTENDNPNPRKDKKFPFCKTVFEPTDYSCFWGKGAPDKMAPEQDSYDMIMRTKIDNRHLKNVPPLSTTNPALVNEDIIFPGNVVYLGGENQRLETIKIDTADDAGTSELLSIMEKNMSNSSLDPMQMGQSPEGGTPTATQAMQMAKNAQIMLGLFGWMFGYLVTEWTRLRCQTLIWRMMQGFDNGQISMNDRVLKNGAIGKRIYIFDDGASNYPDQTKHEVAQKIKEIQDAKGGKVEVIVLDRNQIAKLDLYVRLDATPTPKRTDALMQALAAEKWGLKSQNPQIWNLNYAAKQLAMAWGEDPDEAISQQAQQTSSPDMPSGMPGAPTPPGNPGVMGQLRGGAKTAMGMAPTNTAQMMQ